MINESKKYLKNTNRIIRCVNSDFILSLPQFSPTSESFLLLKYIAQYNNNNYLIIFKYLIIGLIRLLLLLSSIRLKSSMLDIKYKSLVISHDVTYNKDKNDFYFGSSEDIEELCEIPVKLLYISHSLPFQKKDSNSIYINRNISIINYVSTIYWYLNSVIFGLCICVKKPKSRFRNLILKSLLRGDGLESYLRANGLLRLLLCSNTSQVSIYMTIEGHAWEKLIIKFVRNSNNKIFKIYGYVHSVIRRSTVWINNLDINKFTPDVLLISQYEYIKYITRIWATKKIQVELRIHKSLKPKINFCEQTLIKEPHILLLPEGLREEEEVFYNFAILLKLVRPQLKISVKWHPNSKNRTKGMVRSDIFTFSENVNYSHIVYRGTYGIFDFFDSKKILLYLSGVNLPNVNPLFMMKDVFFEISDIQDLIKILEK